MRVLLSVLLLSSYGLPSAFALRPSKLWTAVSPRRPIVSAKKDVAAISMSQSSAAALAATNVSGGASESEEAWTPKRLHNSAAFRGVALLGVLAAAGATSNAPLSLLPAKAAGSIHLLSFGTWFGTVAYTTFVAGITMFKNLPRQTFGRLQAKLFPKYFALCSATLVLQLVTLKSLSGVAVVANKSTKALGVALVMTLVNQFYLEPVSTNNMMERYKLDDTPGGKDTDKYKKLKASFGKFHGMSSLANLIALCAGVAHGVYLGSALV